jgi:hypothetical protein
MSRRGLGSLGSWFLGFYGSMVSRRGLGSLGSGIVGSRFRVLGF